MKYAQRLKDIREDNDLTQEEIAKILETTQQYYGKYEKGIREMPFSRAIKLAQYYDLSLDYIAGLTDTPKTLDGNKYSIQNVNNGNKQNITTISGNHHKITIK